MKRILFLFLLIMICFSFTQRRTVDSEKEFAQNVFEAVMRNDFNLFHKYTVTREEFLQLLPQTDWTEERKEEIRQLITKDYIDQRTIENFEELQTALNHVGIDLSETEPDSVVTEFKMTEGLQELRCMIYFSFQNESYYIRMHQCVKTYDGWKMTNGAYLRGPVSRSIEPGE